LTGIQKFVNALVRVKVASREQESTTSRDCPSGRRGDFGALLGQATHQHAIRARIGQNADDDGSNFFGLRQGRYKSLAQYDSTERVLPDSLKDGWFKRLVMRRLVLTEEEKSIILREVGTDGGSTMGLGALAEGAEVPRDAQVRAFPDTVVRQVPKVQNYKFFAAENRVAIVDPQGSKVQLLIEARR